MVLRERRVLGGSTREKGFSGWFNKNGFWENRGCCWWFFFFLNQRVGKVMDVRG